LASIIGGEVPNDPLGDQQGYWYESDGRTARVIAALEGEAPADQSCESDWEPLRDRDTLICVELE
jgi:hypothetical protein